MPLYIHRTLESVLPEVSRQYPVLLLTGPRQTGKTTLLRHILEPGRNYVSLDSLPVRGLAREDPDLFGGAIFETWCVSEILKSWWYALREPPVYYYQDRDGTEIDLVFEADGTLYPVEIKLGAGPKKDWIRSFRALKNLNLNVGTGAALCLARDSIPLDRQATSVSAGWI